MKALICQGGAFSGGSWWMLRPHCLTRSEELVRYPTSVDASHVEASAHESLCSDLRRVDLPALSRRRVGSC